jgi:hypothetical protein
MDRGRTCYRVLYHIIATNQLEEHDAESELEFDSGDVR